MKDNRRWKNPVRWVCIKKETGGRRAMDLTPTLFGGFCSSRLHRPPAELVFGLLRPACVWRGVCEQTQFTVLQSERVRALQVSRSHLCAAANLSSIRLPWLQYLRKCCARLNCGNIWAFLSLWCRFRKTFTLEITTKTVCVCSCSFNVRLKSFSCSFLYLC